MGNLKWESKRRKEPQAHVIVSWEGYEPELGVLMTLAHIHEIHRLPEHIHSGDTRGWEGMCL